MDCHYLPDHDRRPWARSHMVMVDPEDLGVDECKPFAESDALAVPPVQHNEPGALGISIVHSSLTLGSGPLN